MGCSVSILAETSEDDGWDRNSSSRQWQEIRTESESKAAFTADGSLVDGSGQRQVEFRTLLDFSLAREYILEYIEEFSPDVEVAFRGWLDIHQFNSMPPGKLRDTFASSIYGEYVSGNAGMSSVEKRRILDMIEGKTVCAEDVRLFESVQAMFFKELLTMDEAFKDSDEYRKMIVALKRKYNRVKITDFDYFDVLGEGGYGLVCRVQKRSTGIQYAMKIQKKSNILNMFDDDESWRVNFEKQMFASCHHPFMVELSFAFQTETLAILVMSLGSGQDLAHILNFGGPLSQEQVLFYSAEITSALSYLHHKGFVYRDLKPGNVLLNLDGHIQLVDFGAVYDLKGKTLAACSNAAHMLPVFALEKKDAEHPLPLSNIWGNSPHSLGSSEKLGSFVEGGPSFEIPEESYEKSRTLSNTRQESHQELVESSLRAKSLVGTYGYMAPEMVVMLDGEDAPVSQEENEGATDVGYTKAVDWWSLGVTMYKLLTGAYPFKMDFKDGYGMDTGARVQANKKRHKALFQPVDYRLLRTHPLTVSFITQLLVPEEGKRLGYGNTGSQDVSAHAYFGSIDWVKLESKRVVPPPLPDGCRRVSSAKEFEPKTLVQLLYDARKIKWLKVRRPEDADTMAVPKPHVQSDFDYWDYTSPLAVMIELGHA